MNFFGYGVPKRASDLYYLILEIKKEKFMQSVNRIFIKNALYQV